MKVLNISLDRKLFSSNSAAQKRVINYSRLFDRFDILVATKKGYSKLEFDKMEIWPTNSLSKIFYMHDAYHIGKKIVSRNNDEIISVQDPFELGFVGWLLARKFNLRFQVQMHGDFFGSPYWREESFLNSIKYRLGKFIIRRADSVRVVSQRIKESIEKIGVDQDKILVVPILSNLNSSQILNRGKGDPFIFLTIGRLEKVKNIGLQIEAMAEIIKNFSQTELWIVGEGSEKKQLESKIKKLGLNEKIKMFGWQNNLDEFYQQADAFLLTSNYEGWGMVAIEASSAGLPIVMTDVGCAGEIIKDGESGIVIPVADRQGLKEAMVKLIKNDDFRKKIGEGARQAVAVLPSKEQNLLLYRESLEKAFINK